MGRSLEDTEAGSGRATCGLIKLRFHTPGHKIEAEIVGRDGSVDVATHESFLTRFPVTTEFSPERWPSG